MLLDCLHHREKAEINCPSLQHRQTAPEVLLCTSGTPVPNGTTRNGQEGTKVSGWYQVVLAGTEKDAVTASIGTLVLLSQTVHLGFFMS